MRRAKAQADQAGAEERPEAEGPPTMAVQDKVEAEELRPEELEVREVMEARQVLRRVDGRREWLENRNPS
jgi:hypothetical protein